MDGHRATNIPLDSELINKTAKKEDGRPLYQEQESYQSASKSILSGKQQDYY